MTGALVRRGKFGRRCSGRKPGEGRQRQELCAHKTGSTEDCWRPLEAEKGKDRPPRALRERWQPCWPLDLRPLDSRTVRESTSVVLNHQVHAN